MFSIKVVEPQARLNIERERARLRGLGDPSETIKGLLLAKWLRGVRAAVSPVSTNTVFPNNQFPRSLDTPCLFRCRRHFAILCLRAQLSANSSLHPFAQPEGSAVNPTVRPGPPQASILGGEPPEGQTSLTTSDRSHYSLRPCIRALHRRAFAVCTHSLTT